MLDTTILHFFKKWQNLRIILLQNYRMRRKLQIIPLHPHVKTVHQIVFLRLFFSKRRFEKSVIFRHVVIRKVSRPITFFKMSEVTFLCIEHFSAEKCRFYKGPHRENGKIAIFLNLGRCIRT